MSPAKSSWYLYEGDCPLCARGFIWITPDGTEIRLCHRDAKLAGVKKAGWRLKNDLSDKG